MPVIASGLRYIPRMEPARVRRRRLTDTSQKDDFAV